MSTTETPQTAPAGEEQIEDVTVVEPGQVVGQALMPATPAPVPATTEVNAADLVKRLDTIKSAMNDAMTRDVDFGIIPGTQKPTLLKPGAEKLAVLFQLDVQITHDERYGPGDHLTVPAYATIFHAPTGARLGRGEGLCTTRERKYARRKQDRQCPTCGAEAIIKGKAEYGGGWVCWKRKGGCDAKFPVGNHDIERQEVGEVENPDLPDSWNTVIKMARKRALVDAVLLVTGASALFTQDVEDQAPAADETPETTTAEPPQLPFGMATPAEQLAITRREIAHLIDPQGGVPPEHNLVGQVLNEIEAVTEKKANAAGFQKYLPAVALGAIVRVARAARYRHGQELLAQDEPTTATPGAGDPSGETEEDRHQREYAERVQDDRS